ncbi:MAG: sodium/alanine symporter [Cellvibrionaceae bacterium]|nr:sodium/alanine symporter [Cellvibrionaceae bacterium]
MDSINSALQTFVAYAWGTPLLVLLIGGGVFLLISSRGRPYRHLGHSLALLRGQYDNPDDPGQVSHRQALSTALSGTLGLGNIAGVAIAITAGGPGAIFWMWVTALLGVATKFYTATLAVMYRGKDSQGEAQGGPMYVIREGLGKRWQPLAYLFAIAGLMGMLPLFQANQAVQLLRVAFAEPAGWVSADNQFYFDAGLGVIFAVAVLIVVSGRIQRIGRFAVAIVPAMVIFYLLMALMVIGSFWRDIPAVLSLILSDAFSGHAIAGGALGVVITTGVSRGAFSNEAGIGTESLAHGAAKTTEPVREGVVAMLGPIIDTLVVCSCTALVILLTGVWTQADGVAGVALTSQAFSSVLGDWGPLALLVMVVPLAFSTVVTFWYYGLKCFVFLFGSRAQWLYTVSYLSLIVIGAMASLEIVSNLIIGMYAVMAIPTMVSTLLLSGRVNRAAHDYFTKMEQQ